MKTWVFPVGVPGLLFVVMTGCGSFTRPSADRDDVSAHRISDQIYLDDSLDVFFLDYPNPYRNKEVLWIASYLEGEVELRLHSMENDSLLVRYRFESQDAPLYPLVYRNESDVIVKCVIHVAGRPKCARLMTWISDLPHPQWGTSYTKEEY